MRGPVPGGQGPYGSLSPITGTSAATGSRNHPGTTRNHYPAATSLTSLLGRVVFSYTSMDQRLEGLDKVEVEGAGQPLRQPSLRAAGVIGRVIDDRRGLALTVCAHLDGRGHL